MNAHKKNLLTRDVGIIFLSVMIAVVLAKTGAIKELLVATREAEIMSSIVAGMFFVSVFTAAPAIVALAEIAQGGSLFIVSVFGGIGALLGDLIIFRFVRDYVAEDIATLVGRSKWKRWSTIFHLRLFKWLIPFLGAVIVASPLPDEIGLVMMGMAKMKTKTFIPISFFLNAIGIFIIGLIAR